jgi:hypothetical protein
MLPKQVKLIYNVLMETKTIIIFSSCQRNFRLCFCGLATLESLYYGLFAAGHLLAAAAGF